MKRSPTIRRISRYFLTASLQRTAKRELRGSPRPPQSGRSLTRWRLGYCYSGCRMILEKFQGFLIKLLHFLVQWRVRAPFKDQQLGTADVSLHSIRETRCQHVVAAESDLRWRLDLTELSHYIMSEYRVRVLNERRHRLSR